MPFFNINSIFNKIKIFLKKKIRDLALILKKNNESTPNMWSKIYPSWQIAETNSDGYNSKIILEKTLTAIKAVRDGNYSYERDSVLFDKIEYSWPLLAILQSIAAENNNELTIVDFGGSLGSTYFQNKNWLRHIKVTWIVVEQYHYVETGRKEIENEELLFKHTIEEALNYNPSVALFSSVLQYIDQYQSTLDQFIKKRIKNIVLDRTAIVHGSIQDIVTLQKVDKSIYDASYPCRFFTEENLIDNFNTQYQLITDFESFCDPSFTKDGLKFLWKGYFFKII